MRYTLSTHSLYEQGQRPNQEDALFPLPDQASGDQRLFVVCDGMGGHQHGEIASQTVCHTLSQLMGGQTYRDEVEANQALCLALTQCYEQLDQREDPDASRKMGTTLTLLAFTDAGVMATHIGDSRIYQLRPAQGGQPATIVFRSQDHSLVASLVATGQLTEEEAREHPQRNMITRALMPHSRRDMGEMNVLRDVRRGDYLLMCSDGIVENLEDADLLSLLTAQGMTDEQKVERLRQLTQDNHDNHTCHLIHVTEATENALPSQAKEDTDWGFTATQMLIFILGMAALFAVVFTTSYLLFRAIL